MRMTGHGLRSCGGHFRSRAAGADNGQVHPEPFRSNPQLRASDSDREEAATLLGAALAEGRLSVAEHAQRLDAVYEAKTHAEIAPLIEDLPARGAVSVPAVRTGAEPATRPRSRIIAIFGGTTRKGDWQVEPRMTAVTVFGGVFIDLRDAVLPQREITMHCTSVFGGIEVVVPPETRVVDSGVAVFGGRDAGSGGPAGGGPDAPVLRLKGLTMFGGLSIKHKPRADKDR